MQPIFNSGFVDLWPQVYAEDQVTWSGGNYWDRKYTQSEITGYPWFAQMYIDGADTVAAFVVEISASNKVIRLPSQRLPAASR